MKVRAFSAAERDNLRLLLIVGLLCLAAALRVWGLDRDPPPYDVLPDAAPWTDEGTIGLPAYEAYTGAISLPAMLADGGRPLHRMMLLEAFRSPGSARFDGRMLSVLFGMLGLLALAALGERLWPGPGALLVLLIAGVGFFFVIYDRLLLTEGPLLALLALLALAGLRARTWVAALAVGVGLSLLAVGFKLHAFALGPALAVLYGLRRRRLLIPFLVGTAGAYLAWRWVFIPAQAPGYTGYLQERLTSDQLGLVGPLKTLPQILLAGLPGRYLSYQIPVLMLASLEGMSFFLSPRRWLREAHEVSLLALVWLLAALIGAGMFRYLPPRYFHLASPALLLLAISGAQRFWLAVPFPHSSEMRRRILAMVAGAFFVGQVAGPMTDLIFRASYVWVLVTGLFLLAAFAVVLWRMGRWGRQARVAVLAGLLAAHVGISGGLYAVGVAQSRPMLAQAAASLSALPSNAVLTGRLAGTVALITPLHGAPQLERVSLSYLNGLAPDGEPVWVLILARDEYRVDGNVWPLLQQQATFPVNYSSTQPSVSLYRFRPTTTALK
jgi:hypothetical protein